MKKKFLKLLKRYHGALLLEDIVSHKTRKFLVNFCGATSLLLLVGAIFSAGDLATKLRGGFLGFLLFFIFFLILEAYFYSAYKARLAKEDMLSFEAARMIFYSEDDDLTVGFLYCDTGDEVMKRLGFDEIEIGQILRNRPKISFSAELLDLSSGATLEDLMHLIFEKDLFLQHELSKKAISFEDFFHTVKWVLEKEEREIFDERWWSKERLQRVPALGKNWSYGETFTLNKYGIDLTETGVSHFASFEALHDVNISKIEHALVKQRGANAIVLTDDESLREDLMTIFARRIRENRSLRFLSKSRVFLLNTNLLIENSEDKLSFEREFSNILFESAKAKNIILVFPFWTAFEKSAESLGSDVSSLILPFLESPYIHIVLLEPKKEFSENLFKKQSLLFHFETIVIEEGDNHSLEALLEREIEQVEYFTGVLFTYKAIKEIANLSKRYFESFEVIQKARDLLIDSLKVAKLNKRRFVLGEDVLRAFEEKTGIPQTVPEGEEKEKLLSLREILHKKIVGQTEAIDAISGAMLRARSGVQNPNRPLGSFLFLGPTGVGKTETTKALASVFFKSEKDISRFDMSEFSASDALQKLIGVAGQSGQLSEKLREKPYAVLLLDEFEKANSEVHDLFLQILDEGEFTDGAGRKVSARSNIIIATSNAGSGMIWDVFNSEAKPSLAKDSIVENIVQEGVFRPELLNRFDDIVVFHPIEGENLFQVGRLVFKEFSERMKQKGLTVLETENALKYLSKAGTDPKFGARPLRRALQDDFERLVAENLIKGNIKVGSTISFDTDENQKLILKVH